MRSAHIKSIRPLSVSVSAKTVWTLVEITDTQGRRGLGETTGSDSQALKAQIQSMGASLLGKPLPERQPQGAGTVHIPAAEIRAASAIDQAVWDLRAQDEGKSLAAALGQPRRDATRTYANMNRGLTDRNPSAFGRRAAEARASGFDAFKIAPFDGVTTVNCDTVAGQGLIESGLARVAAVREAIGSQGDLLVDCHWRFDERAAATVIDRLAELGVSWVECPLPEIPETFPSLARLRRRANGCGMRLAGADEIADPAFFGEIITAGIYDVVMPDVKHLGGLSATLRLAQLAEEKGVTCSFHNPTGPIAHLHSVHLSALLESSLYLEFPYAETPLFTGIVQEDPAVPVGGLAKLPAAAGLGVQLDVAALRVLAELERQQISCPL